jgi:hypothetical protein
MGNLGLNCGGMCGDTNRGKDELLLQSNENMAKLEEYQNEITSLIKK